MNENSGKSRRRGRRPGGPYPGDDDRQGWANGERHRPPPATNDTFYITVTVQRRAAPATPREARAAGGASALGVGRRALRNHRTPIIQHHHFYHRHRARRHTQVPPYGEIVPSAKQSHQLFQGV